jgi:hypothetical protein
LNKEEPRFGQDFNGINLTHPIILLLRREGFIISGTFDM